MLGIHCGDIGRFLVYLLLVKEEAQRLIDEITAEDNEAAKEETRRAEGGREVKRIMEFFRVEWEKKNGCE